jgi:Ca2+-binding RTX toxin-like protein
VRTPGHICWALTAAVLISWGVPAPGLGATVNRGSGPNAATLFFDASANEANDLVVSHGPGTFTFSDRGAPVQAIPGSGCSQTADPGVVTCDDTGIAMLWVELRDRDDSASNATATAALIKGGTGADTLQGGAASDSVIGEAGDDVLGGEAGDDQLYGDDSDPIASATGADTINGGPGDDAAAGGPGDDRVAGDPGADSVSGDSGADVVSGGDGADRLSGADGADRLDGGAGDDVVGIAGNTGGISLVPIERGPDIADGGAGDDLVDPGGAGDDDGDVLSGGDGTDTVSYTVRQSAVDVSKDSVRNDGQPGEGDDVNSDVERLVGGAADDVLTGGAGDDEIDGGPGDDTIAGLGGRDTLNGGRDDGGSDRVSGGDGGDVVLGDGGNDRLTGDAGGDRLFGGTSDDSISGGTGDDRLQGEDGADRLVGGGGGDQIGGGAGQDDASYPNSARPVEVRLDGRANDGAVVRGKSEGDFVQRDVEDVTGARQQDTFTGDVQANELSTGSGQDYVDGRRGADDLSTGAGRDVVRARDGVRDVVGCGGDVDFAIVDRRDSVKRRGPDRCETVEDGSTTRPEFGRLVFARPGGCSSKEELGLALPGSERLVPLVDDVRLPVGSRLDAEAGCLVDIVAAARGGEAPRVLAKGAEFRLAQRRSSATALDLQLDAPRCGRGGRADRHAHAARHRRPPYSFVVRASSRRNRDGRRAAAAALQQVTPRVRVTALSSIATARTAAVWTTLERCSSTRSTVRQGTVEVRDRRTGARVVLRAGDSYTARRRG